MMGEFKVQKKKREKTEAKNHKDNLRTCDMNTRRRGMPMSEQRMQKSLPLVVAGAMCP